MDIFKEILSHILLNKEVKVEFKNLEIDINKIIEGECYKALNNIRDIICDETLDDSDCFNKIEEIIILFEKLGIESGSRHDFI